MKKIIISTFDMEIGGVERSLISLLESFDYSQYDVDLMLYRHQGEFLSQLPKGPNLLSEIPQYATFRKSIKEIISCRNYSIALSRVFAKYIAMLLSIPGKNEEPGYLQMQLGWKLALPALPGLKKEYDVAVSYLWPHYFIADKVTAKKKIAWVHTDYSTIKVNAAIDAKVWGKFDWIVTVSESCREAFIKRYPQFEKRTVVIENIISPEFIKKMAKAEYAKEIKDIKGALKIITVARLSHAKGIDDAVKACRKLLDEGYNIAWYVVGYGGEEASIKTLIGKLGLENNFILLGKKINPYPYIDACDIYVQPSRYEGKAVTVIEAQILGKPVLITNYATAKSQVKDRVDGFITGLGVDGIAAGIKKLIDDHQLRMKLRQNTLSSNYDNAFEIEKLYRLMNF